MDRINIGAEALRSPDEIGRMLKEAEGKLGALTEVFGGTCAVANMFPAKFACVGCAGNARTPPSDTRLSRSSFGQNNR